MSAQQQQQVQVQQLRPVQLHQQQQQQPWWASPLHGIGSALQGMQHNLRQLADNLPKLPGHQQDQAQRARAVAQPLIISSSSGAVAPLQGPARLQGHASQHAVPASGLLSSSTPAASASARPRGKQQQVQAVTKEELGRATWVFLHTLAAQFPERPTRQQQRDARQLVDSLTRIYPCADCAQHFQEIVRRDPPDVSDRAAFSQWMCRVHNCVNRRLGKPTFNCDLVGARWAPLDCDEHNSCDMTVDRRPR